MLGIDNFGIPENLVNVARSMINPTSRLVTEDEIHIIMWTIRICKEAVERADIPQHNNSFVTIALEEAIKKLRGEELAKVMRFMVSLLMLKGVDHFEHINRVRDNPALREQLKKEVDEKFFK